jgi:ubiquinone/menaquinone biosynthesis C-methylase UbiE
MLAYGPTTDERNARRHPGTAVDRVYSPATELGLMPRRRDVRETYERIAAHFAQTRPEPWEEVADFLDGRSGAVGLDIGAGNGRHTELLAARVDRVIALDASYAAIETAMERGADRGFGFTPCLGDASRLPLKRSVVDLAAYIAAIHHLPSRGARIASLDELARVLTPGGAAVVSAWSVSHGRFDRNAAFDTEIDWTLPDGEEVPRFYHVYDLSEFETDLHRSDLRVTEAFESHGNCYGVVAGPPGDDEQ